MYLSVAILRVPQGLDCSQLLGSPEGGWTTANCTLDVPRTLQPNESSNDLQASEHIARHGLSGSVDSLSRNVSQGKLFPAAVQLQVDHLLMLKLLIIFAWTSKNTQKQMRTCAH